MIGTLIYVTVTALYALLNTPDTIVCKSSGEILAEGHTNIHPTMVRSPRVGTGPGRSTRVPTKEVPTIK